MYCRQCGEKLTLRFCENEGLVPYCDKCEAYIFPQFNVAVSMVVTNRAQDKILLAKHVEDEDFILFAGYIKKGEKSISMAIFYRGELRALLSAKRYCFFVNTVV